MQRKKEETTVASVEIDLDDILGTGSDSIMIPDEEKEKIGKPNIFSKVGPSKTFLDNVAPTSKEEEDADDADDELEDDDPEKEINLDSILNPKVKDETEGEVKKTGRPKSITSLAKKLLKDELIMPFEGDDEKAIDNYTEDDFYELLKLNMEHQKEQLANQLPQQFFQNMPTEMQVAYQYIADGGQDLKGMFKALSDTRTVLDLNPEKPGDQKEIIRSYLEVTRWGDADEIQDELYGLEDKGELEKKAKQFKPKLDSMQEQAVAQRLQQQKFDKQRRQDASQAYMESVYNTLAKGKIGELDLDERTQNMLYSGLVHANYQTGSGERTNLLGKLLRKHQYEEPNHALIAEALWLLADPDSYRAKVAASVKKDADAATLRRLKTEEASQLKGGGSTAEEEQQTTRRPGIKKPKRNFFER